MANTPLVSVITPVYNMERYIDECIRSVLAQTYPHFELLLIDDCSTDGTRAILERYAGSDTRIKVLSTPVNSWAHAAGNVGLDHASGELIAILDSDDMITPDRLAVQVAYLQTHPDIDVVGGWMKKFGDDGTVMKTFPREDAKIRMGMLFDSTMGHGTAMIRRHVIENAKIRYNTDIFYTHDYDFFTQLAYDGGAKFSSVPQIVYHYRWHNQQTSVARRAEQIGYADRVRAHMAARFDLTDPALLAIHLGFCKKEAHKLAASHADIVRYMDALVAGNRAHDYFPDDLFIPYLTDRIMRGMARRGLDGLRFYGACPYANQLKWSLADQVKFRVKCLAQRRKRAA